MSGQLSRAKSWPGCDSKDWLGLLPWISNGVSSEDSFKGRKDGFGLPSVVNVLSSPLGARYRATCTPGHACSCCFENACCLVHAASRSGAVCRRLLAVGSCRQTSHIELWPDLLP